MRLAPGATPRKSLQPPSAVEKAQLAPGDAPATLATSVPWETLDSPVSSLTP